MPAQPNSRGFLTGPASASVNEHERWVQRGKTGVTPTTNDRCLAWMKARENWGRFLGDAKREPAWLYFVGEAFVHANAAEIDEVRGGPPTACNGPSKEERLAWAAEHHARANKFSKRNTHVGDVMQTHEELMAATERSIAKGVYQAHDLPHSAKASAFSTQAPRDGKHTTPTNAEKQARKHTLALHMPKNRKPGNHEVTAATVPGQVLQALQLDPDTLTEMLTQIAREAGQVEGSSLMAPTVSQAQYGDPETLGENPVQSEMYSHPLGEGMSTGDPIGEDVRSLQAEFEEVMDGAEKVNGDKIME